VLTRPFTAVISQSAAKILFGNTNPINKRIISFDNEFLITGVMKDIQNFHVDIDILFSQATLPIIDPDLYASISAGATLNYSATYLLTSPGTDRKALEIKIGNTLSELNNGEYFLIKFKKFHVRPLKEIYFFGATMNHDYGHHGNYNLVRIFIVVSIFTLFLGIINYVNLSTAKSSLRTKEIAIKKISGSTARLLGAQLMLESIIVSMISFMLAITFVQGLATQFSRILMMNLNFAEYSTPGILALALGGVIVIGLLAGIYPVILLTSHPPVSLIKKTFIKSAGRTLLRKGLMTMQFMVSIVLLIGVLINYRQMNFARNMDTGFDRVKIISVIPEKPDSVSLHTFKGKLLQESTISTVSFTFNNPGDPTFYSTEYEIDGKRRLLTFFLADPDYLDLMGIKVVEGTGFSYNRPGEFYDTKSNRLPGRYAGMILNEAAVKKFDLKDPIGKVIIYPKERDRYKFKIIGIVKDFNFQSIHHKVEPLCMIWMNGMKYVNIKCNTSDYDKVLKSIAKHYKESVSSLPLVYHFLDEAYDLQYRNDERSVKVIGYFTVLAIIIACMGLFALSSFMVSRRTKEIGIRKTLGASVRTIYGMLSWDFLKWILLAVVIACPVGWYLMDRWLENFAYHIDITIDIFVIAALIAISIALLTITWQAIKTARANPVEALRYE
jgi:putative ABC transport system permease protein